MSTSRARRPLGILYEHPDWFRPLFAELDRRSVPYARIHADGHSYDPGAPAPEVGVLFNRMSPSAWRRGRAAAVLYTEHYLGHLEGLGVRVLNGLEAWRTEISKARQLGILHRLGLAYPRARVLSDPASAPEAARDLRFPVVVKPNIGGSGAGIRRFDTREELGAAAAELDLGIDRTGLVQEYVPPRDGHVVRVEVLGGRYLYAIAVHPPEGSFNLCPADACVGADGRKLERTFCAVDAADNGMRVEAFEPPEEVRRQVERIMAASGIEVGGVEYLVDDRDGAVRFYDVNALSNFVADAENVVGFDPFARLVDWLEEKLERPWMDARPADAAGAARRSRTAATHRPADASWTDLAPAGFDDRGGPANREAP